MKFSSNWITLLLCVLLFAGCSREEPPIFQLIQLFQEGKHDQAIELAEKLTAENPDNSQAYRFLIKAAVASGRGEEYRSKYQELAKADPDVAGYHLALGYCDAVLGNLEAALPEFQKALDVNPDIEYAHYMIGWIYMDRRFPDANAERGLAEWEKEEELDPRSLGALQVYTGRANYYLRMGDGDAAEKNYEKIAMYAFARGDIESARQRIQMIRSLRDELARLEADAKENPEDPEVRLQLGILQYKNAKITDAIETWQKASELDPENAEIRNFLGKALLEIGRHEEAALQLQKAIELDPMDATVYYNLAVAEEVSGKTAMAIEHYKKYMDLNPMAPKLDEVKEKVAALERKTAAEEGKGS